MLYGVVLAGGRSSRMGQDKALLEYRGVTLLDRARQLLTAAGAEKLLVSGRPELADGIPDLFAHSGPPAALYATLDYLRTSSGTAEGHTLLIIPVDMPLLTADTLARLPARDTADACVHFADEVFPCLIRSSNTLFEHLQQLFAEDRHPGGQRSMKALFSFLQARSLSREDIDAREFSNVNTPQEWQSLL